jgi:hypothetical protein
VLEAAGKTLATQRLKRSGRRWRQAGGQAILTFRSFCQSDRFDRAWELLAGTYKQPVGLPRKVIALSTTFQSFKFSSIEAEVFMMIFRSGQPSYEMLDSTSGHPHSLCLSRCHR